jgi:16S rRNA (guanine527-N7)-methyltransferase
VKGTRRPSGRGWESEALSRLRAGLQALAVQDPSGLIPDCEDRLMAYLQLLVRWNSVYNLTAVRDPVAMVAVHLLDSLAIRPWVREATGPVLDLGTGAGLPGIPLVLTTPTLSMTLLDSNAKKVRFLRQAVVALGLAQTSVAHVRVEDCRPAQGFEVIVTRAYARMPALLADAAPLLAPGGRILAMKGRFDLVAEPMGKDWHHRCYPIVVPGLGAERCLVELSASNAAESANMQADSS